MIMMVEEILEVVRRLGVLGTRQGLATLPVRVDIEEVVPIRESELTLAVEESRSVSWWPSSCLKRELGRKNNKERVVVRWMNPEILSSRVERSYWS